MKIVKVLLCFLCFAQWSTAQVVGLKAGILHNQVQGRDIPAGVDESLLSDALIGFTFGAMVRKELKNNFYLKSEFAYSQKGESLPRSQTDIKLRYLEISAMVMVPLFKNASLDIGLAPAYLFQGSPIYDKFDLGLLGGLTYLLKDKVEISARYSYGLSAIGELNFTNDVGTNLGAAKYYNNTISFSVGYYFM